jgi:hypothetical protein
MNTAISKSMLGSAQSAIALCLVDGCWLYIVVWLVGKVVFGSTVVLALPQPLVLAALEVGGWAVTSALLERGRLSDRLLRVVMSLLGLAFALLLAFVYNPINIFAL